MKTATFNALLLIATAVVGTKAQVTSPVQNESFANWVIESNLKTPRNSVVKFYNAKQDLIYQEEIKDRRLNVSRVEVQYKLNQILAQLLEKNLKIKESNLVAISLKEN